MKQISSIIRKELDSYFGSPMAIIFLGTFLAVTLFTFFWVDTFFARGVADVRPLFRWMPILLIFLVSALTMRQWSEEQRSGTLEILLTLPVKAYQLVLGKFLAVLILVGIALILTLPLPIMVATLGNLDWGPVIGGYVAAILLASAYTAIGLFISSRTDNQIVALILTIVLGGLFYMVGTSGITDFTGGSVAEILRAVGTGSRFESIERGVLDLRDLVYYLSLSFFFLALNTLSLDSKRWSQGASTKSYRFNANAGMLLLALNLIALNIWLYPLRGLRLDITDQQEYSLSQTTKNLLDNLQEPLLVRAYISDKTHPLLAPLNPRIADLLEEYEIAANGNVTAEVIDPIEEPELEAEANQTYGIQPVPFQVLGRYESSLINSYFDILIRYGDQNVVLGFDELIEVEPHRDGTIDVRLRNLEYDLTRAIKKVVFGFQSVDAVLATLSEPVELTVYITPDSMPEELVDAPETIQRVAEEIATKSDGKFLFTVVNPDAPDAAMNRQQLLEQFGLQPYAVSFFSEQTFYMHMILKAGDTLQLIDPGGDDITEGSIRSNIEAALKRTSNGFLKEVGLWTPPTTPTPNAFGQMQPPLSNWQLIQEQLSQEYSVNNVDLSTGQVPNVDVLLLVAPQNLTDRERFAVDQYLMRGGSVIVAASNYGLQADNFTGGLALQPLEGTLQEMLNHYGVDVQSSVVMDPQNQPFPVMVNRQVGGFQVQEVQAINYPFFVDVRPDGMDSENAMLSGLPAATLNWVSPIVLDEAKNAERTVSELMHSTEASWLRTETDIQPNQELYPEFGFPIEGTQSSHVLAVSVQGVFNSFFADKSSPFETEPEPLNADGTPADTPMNSPIPGTVESSAETARLVVIGSAEFLDDFVLDLSSRLTQDQFLNNLQLAQNAVDWSVEDLDLLSIRSRGTHSRVLVPMETQEQSTWELGIYIISLLALLVIGGMWSLSRRNEQPMQLIPRDQL